MFTHLSGGSLINAGNVTLAARLAPNTTTPLVVASATGSSGAMVGLTATEARASNNSATRVLAEKSTLAASGIVLVTATSRTSQSASASGLAVGLVAAGANNASASSTTTTTALLSDMVGVTGGAVRLVADGDDANVANAESGSGGLIAGAAASASTASTSTVRAAADTSTTSAKYLISALGGDVEISATHSASFAGKVDSTQASLAGASGATLSHAVNANVDAHLGDDAYVRAANLAISANNLLRNYFIGETAGNHATFNSDNAGWNVDSGSGGIINLPAGASFVSFVQNSSATIGKRADVHLLLPSSGYSTLTLAAHNDAIVHQKVRLDSGGAIALADTAAAIAGTANADVAVGDLSEVVVDVGDIALAAWSDADIEARAAATTYGLAGAPSGRAHAVLTTNNRALIGSNVRLEATRSVLPAVLTSGLPPTHGTIGINAGADLNGRLQALRLRTTVDLFNKTAIPISTTPDALSDVTSNSSVIIGAVPLNGTTSQFYGVHAAGDITLRASRGSIDATAVGTGKDIYREALAAAASAISNLFGGGDVTFDYHGGTVKQNGLGTVRVDGLVDTGLQRYQTVAFNYTANCDVTASACVTASGSGDVKYGVSGPQAVGTDILKRMLELKDLLAQYSSDPVAAGAYQSEIHFLEKKLVSLGLGSFDTSGKFVAGSYAGPSPKEAALALVAQTERDISTAKASLGAATAAVVVGDVIDLGTNLLSAYTDNTHGLESNVSSVKTTVAALGNFSSLTTAPTEGHPNDKYSQSFVDTYNGLGTLVSDGKQAATTVKNLTADSATRQETINTRTLEIQNLQNDLAQAQIANNAGAITTILTNIAGKQSDIRNELDAIASNNAQIATQSGIAKSKADAAATALNTLITAASNGSDGDKAKIALLDASAARATISASASTAPTRPTPIPTRTSRSPCMWRGSRGSTGACRVSSAPPRRRSTPSRAPAATSLGGYVTSLNQLASTLGANKQAAASASSSSGTPMAYAINVADTLAQLGNVSVVADRLEGQGTLSAPGDARIDIVNNTANTLKLGDLIIPSYDAGRVRFNGVMVASNADINKLNPGGNGANFTAVVTAATSSRPQVTITSNYNPESKSYYDPTSALSHLKTPQLAPDIILGGGKTIDNLTGKVEITSAAGNIYVNGAINAGSVTILAKNGDFVSSYVNGFDHIGGDPASFNNPTRAGEAGKGIIANGAVSIAARYININGTIQSGIADWTLNLDGAPTLTTTDPTAIGVLPDDAEPEGEGIPGRRGGGHRDRQHALAADQHGRRRHAQYGAGGADHDGSRGAADGDRAVYRQGPDRPHDDTARLADDRRRAADNQPQGLYFGQCHRTTRVRYRHGQGL